MTDTNLHIRFSGANDNNGVLMEVRQDHREEPEEIFFRSQDIVLAPNAEAILCAAILPCMRMGRGLSVEGQASQRMLQKMDSIVDLYRSWEPSLKDVPITGVSARPPESRHPDRVAVFFSGGVDSYYTLLKHFDEITDLIFVHGFDIRLEDEPLRQKTSQVIRDIGSRFGKRVIEIETNLKSLLSPHVCWGLSHGAALAAVGHLLPPEFRRIYIAATHTFEDSFAWGSHPELDPLWSSESLEFVHDGCEARRVEKVASIAQSDVALQTLRVCFKNPNGAYNCGRCEKCLRTMINLHLAGALDRCTTFDTPLTTKRIAKLLAPDDNTRAFFQENRDLLKGREVDKELLDAVNAVLARPRWWTLWLKFAQNPAYGVTRLLRDRAPESFQILRRIYHTVTGRSARSRIQR